jgi:hypothetical protein
MVMNQDMKIDNTTNFFGALLATSYGAVDTQSEAGDLLFVLFAFLFVSVGRERMSDGERR